MRRRCLLLGGAGLVAARAHAQPMPLVGPVGRRSPRGGPLWSLNAGPPGVTLDLNFMTMGGVLDPRITFTRASTASYFNSAGVMQAAATNAARFDYNPSTLVLNGLLIEEARTNVCVPSVPDTTTWTQATSTLTPAATTAPDGTSTGTLLVDNATNASHGLTTNGNFTYGNSQTYAFSIFAKAATAHVFQIYTGSAAFTNAYANFDVTAGTVGTVAGGTALIQNVGNGWWRCTLVAAATASVSASQFSVGLTNNSTSASRAVAYAGTGTGVYLWGGQNETPFMSTSYIPTVGASVTRAVDVCSMPTGAWFNSSVSSLCAEYLSPPVLPNPSSGVREACGLSDGTVSNRLVLRALAGSASTANFYSSVAGTSLVSPAISGTVANAVTKLAAGWNGTAPRGTLNGGTVVSYSQGMPAGLNALTIGNNVVGQTAVFDGPIRRIRYWPRMLTDAELQSVTT